MIVTPGGTAVVPEQDGKHKDKPKKGKQAEPAFPTEQPPGNLRL